MMRHRLAFRAAVAGVVGTVALSAGIFCFADNGIVKTKEGAAYQGDVKDRGDNVVITIHGIDTVIPKTEIASIERVGSYADDFHARLAKLGQADVAGRITLAREAFDKRQYELAREAAESALAADNNSREATDMLELIRSQVRLERAKADNPTVPTGTGASTAPPVAQAPNAQPGIERRLLSNGDIETIRRMELQATDTTARIRFEGDVKKRFADSQNIPFAQFNGQSPTQQAIQILDKGEKSMKEKVHVMSDPQSITEYRGQIQPLVLRNCATSNCHGSVAGGRFVLYTSQEANDQVAYTNLYILEKFAMNIKSKGDTESGVFGGKSEKRMVDRGHGEESLLANFGLPTTVADPNHPLVNGKAIAPIFRGKDDPRYQMILRWMDKSLTQIQPEYGITYVPPVGATTEPASEDKPGPATRPTK